MKQKSILSFIVAVVAVFGFTASVFAAGNIDPVQRYSQFLIQTNGNIDRDSSGQNDFINWSPTYPGSGIGATVTDTAITGNIWGETVGWINLNPTSPNPPSNICNGSSHVVNTCSGELSGCAWGQNAGWINFRPAATIGTGNEPKINTTTGKITGTVWSQNYGWIQLSSTQVPTSDSSYNSSLGLVTSWHGCSTPTDVCPNLTGNQATVPSGYVLQNGQCIIPSTGGGGGSRDLCLNIAGVQPVVPSGYYKVPNDADTPGNCYLPGNGGDNDLCPNIIGIQTSVPVGLVLHNGQCIADVIDGDMCVNLVGTQTSVPPGYIRDAAGYCYESDIEDLCTNITGIQTTVPPGYTHGADGTCYIVPNTNDVCPNLTGTQIVVPVGYTLHNGLCVLNSGITDVCPNLAGTQASIPAGYEVDINGYCVIPPNNPYDECPNLDGIQPPGTICTPISIDNPVTYICSDGLDNDHDGHIDYPDDPGCTSSIDNTEENPPGIDNPFNPTIPTIFAGSTLKGLKTAGYIIGILGLLGTIPGMIPRIGNLLLAIPFYRRNRPYGIVFDSETKEPLDPVSVTVYDADSGKLIDTKITDINGRYGFLLPKGNYRMEASKTHYQFPSQKLLHQNSDGVYDHLYFGENFSVVDDSRSAVIVLNIPMDRLATDWNQEEKKRMGMFRIFTHNTKLWSRISLAIFIIGFIFSAYVLSVSPVTWNIIVFALYVVFAILQLTGNGPVHSGILTDKSGKGIPFAVIRVWSAHLGTQIAQRITDIHGQYYLLVAKGDYYITVDVKNASGGYDRVLTSETMKIKHGIINKSFTI